VTQDVRAGGCPPGPLCGYGLSEVKTREAMPGHPGINSSVRRWRKDAAGLWVVAVTFRPSRRTSLPSCPAGSAAAVTRPCVCTPGQGHRLSPVVPVQGPCQPRRRAHHNSGTGQQVLMSCFRSCRYLMLSWTV